MRFTIRSLLVLFAFGATFAYAQTNNIPQIQHVIVVIQENRTPTNLFHEDINLRNHGAHVVPPNNQGRCHYTHPAVTLTGAPLALGADPHHDHRDSWTAMYDGGLMDGACDIKVSYTGCDTSNCPYGLGQYCQYTYVSNTDGTLNPYFQIADQYGFANWMFQTNQGPSQEAHQFLFSGTSAPDFYGDQQQNCGSYPCWQWFAAENDGNGGGCLAPSGAQIWEIAPDGTYSNHGYQPPGETPGYPCFYHSSLPTLLKDAGISWRHYTNSGWGIWNAPKSIGPICGPDSQHQDCQGSEYTNNVYVGNPAQLLTDLGANPNDHECNLQRVSWVIPDGNWSDHPGQGSIDAGPSWVAAIVNGVGGFDNAGHPVTPKCYDTVGEKQIPYWQDTAILITWDDWGGFFDDILPPDCRPGPSGSCSGYANGGGNGKQYVYGFRVPLLVVSAYTPPGYISGPCNAQTGDCTGARTSLTTHDFGSILNFVEYVFGQNGQYLDHGAYPTGIGDYRFPYADYFAPDAYPACLTCSYSLSDFFDFSTYGNLPRSFTPIIASYGTSCFFHPTVCFGTGYPADPDDDAIDP